MGFNSGFKGLIILPLMRIITTKFEADLPHCVRNVKEKNVLLFKFRCNIFIGVRIIKEIPGSVASGTPCILWTPVAWSHSAVLYVPSDGAWPSIKKR